MEKFVISIQHLFFRHLKKLMEKILSPKKQRVLQPLVLQPVRNPQHGLSEQMVRPDRHLINN